MIIIVEQSVFNSLAIPDLELLSPSSRCVLTIDTSCSLIPSFNERGMSQSTDG
jgi:hypothetical protein